MGKNISPNSIDLSNLETILSSFLKVGEIKPEIASKEINKIDKKLRNKQLEIIKGDGLEERQNTIFNAFRNIRVFLLEMKEQLNKAFKKGENPTTAERCINLVPSMKALYQKTEVMSKEENNVIATENNIRKLRKKARDNDLLPPIENELREMDLPFSEVKDFCNSLNEFIESETNNM